MREQLPLILAWLAYAAVHSLLASFALKSAVIRRFPRLAPAYRLIFNLIATLGLVPLLWLVAVTPGAPLWSWQGPWGWLANGIAAAAVGVMVFGSAGYDMGEFIGLRQWREKTLTAGDGGPFALSALHRFVRHPWYCLGLIIVWSRDMNESMFICALGITIYFVVGSRLEETKLIALYGDTYRHYRQRVSGLVPLPWKILSRDDAERLLAGASPPKEDHS